MLSILFFAALFAAAACNSINPRIVQGIVADKNEFPWQLSLQLDGSHICGAAVVSANAAITAAHCVDFSGYEVNRFAVVCGLHSLTDDGQRRVASKITKHPSYDANAFGYPNDIAVIKFDIPFDFDASCQPARLPRDNTKTYVKDARISGWGRLYGNGPLPTLLKKADIPVITNTQCGTAHSIIGIINPIRASHICVLDPTGVHGACNGDSGGPMTVLTKILATTRWSA
ncbi:fibrinolytic enzyme, isozyme C-like [Pomacea canaliculata]|uniref:fibrinolytic enzyme, isozyme C-like n=1 Tax=Pomacea canaliculata TaxID=400727 RepID=UPI000D72E4DE|nr:fibrinolytic enzyme, isozyme C-like [Pomacea canaliculata]